MEIGETLYIINREDWRKWLEENSTKKKEIWLIYYKKHTKNPTIPYDDAVEEALCFGWIDSTVKRIDNEKYAQRYTPRNHNSVWSPYNINRVKKMIKEGKMTKNGLIKYEYGIRHNLQVPTTKETLNIPVELKKILKENDEINKKFQQLSKSKKIMYSHWIKSAKKKETKIRRIKKLKEMLNET